MALNKSSLLIRDYDNIRQILRDIFIFGCFTRDDFIEMGISGRKYDNEQRRINAYLPDKFIQKRRYNKKVLLYCKYNMEDSTKNFLADTYRNKTFTLLDILSYFYVLQILDSFEQMTLPEILDAIPYVTEEVEFTKDNLRVKLDELIDAGFVINKKTGRNVYYSLSKDIWSDFSDAELKDIYTYLEFVKNVSPLEMPYYYLQRKLKLYLFSERKVSVEISDQFQFKHNHVFNALDNDVLLTCLVAIHNKYTILVKKEGKGSDVEFETLPMKVIHDSTYGRQYLECFNILNSSVTTIRIDKIRAISCVREQTIEEISLVSINKDFDKLCWCTSGRTGELAEVVVNFEFDEIKESYILNRIKREGHDGIVKKISDGVFQYRIKLSDPNEIIPWVRSFAERARVISSGDFRTENIILEDWRKAVEKYESLQ